jgi:hypothetical protein
MNRYETIGKGKKIFHLYSHFHSKDRTDTLQELIVLFDWLFPLAAGTICLIIYKYRKKGNNKRYDYGTSTS